VRADLRRPAGRTVLAVWVLGAGITAFGALPLRTGDSPAEWDNLAPQIAFYRTNEVPARLWRETLRPEALIWPGDRDPLDVVQRRTMALLSHLERTQPELDWRGERAVAGELELRSRQLAPARREERRTLFAEWQALRRRTAFKNPLLDFADIVFLTHHRQGRGDVHMVDQYEGHNARPGGGLYLLRGAFSASPRLVEVLAHSTVRNGRLRGQKLEGGSFISLELDYDAAQVYFAWTQAREVPAGASWEGQFWTREEAAADGKLHYYWSEETSTICSGRAWMGAS